MGMPQKLINIIANFFQVIDEVKHIDSVTTTSVGEGYMTISEILSNIEKASYRINQSFLTVEEAEKFFKKLGVSTQVYESDPFKTL